MGKRVAVVLSGCGPGDGSEIRESLLVQLSLARAGVEVIFAAPDVEQVQVFDHARGQVEAGAPRRRVLAESARIARGRIRPLSALQVGDFDAMIFPGGAGVGTVLSNYNERGDHCDVDPDVARLLKAALAAHRPIGLVCLAPILAARVLGPVAGVHLTLGPRGTAAAKHAAVMGADVRPCPANDIFIDRKNRVVSTPTDMYDDVKLIEVAQAIEKLVRTVLQLTRADQRAPQEQPRPGQQQRPAQQQRPGQQQRQDPRAGGRPNNSGQDRRDNRPGDRGGGRPVVAPVAPAGAPMLRRPGAGSRPVSDPRPPGGSSVPTRGPGSV
jgi:enhancing lycopene biosynthesis protein 2